MRYITVFITVPNKKTGNKIIKHLIENKLAACAVILQKAESVYWWENKICKSKELLIIFKSVGKNFAAMVKEIKKIHPYKVPEIICLDVKDADKDYLDWIRKTVKTQ